MRLTLRTLLAYLDDTLEPNEIKAIGQKVAESDAAQELIARIKQVTRRRRLTAPPATGPGAKWDPNTVAEYLDNVLPGDQISEVEETCLASDVHLAEIAACHQILTLVLGEPALVPPTAKQRMYGLVQGREAIPYRKPSASPRGDGDQVPADGADADETLLLGLPLYRKQGWLRWAIPLAALLLLVALGIAIWQALPSTSSQQRVAQSNEPPSDGQPVQTPPDPGKTDEPGKGPKDQGQQNVGGNPPDGDNKPPDKTPPAKPPEETKKPEEANMELPPPAKPSTEAKEVGKYLLGSHRPNVLVQRAAGGEQWKRVRPETRISSQAPLVSLPGYRSEVSLDSGVDVMLWGNLPVEQIPFPGLMECAVTFHAAPAAAADGKKYASLDADLTLHRGRIALTNRKNSGPARVRVRIHEEVWDLTLLEPGTEVVLDLLGRYMPDVGFRGGLKPRAELYLVVLKGNLSLRVDTSEFPNMQEPPGPALFSWENERGGKQGPDRLEKLLQLAEARLPPPGAGGAQAVPMYEQLLRVFYRGGIPTAPDVPVALEELSSRLTDKSPVDVVLSEILQDDKPSRKRIFAVLDMAAIDDLPHLMDALAHPKDRLTRDVAIFALRHWIGARGDHDEKLYGLLEGKYGPIQSEVIMTLLHDFSEKQRTEPETYLLLINYLRHENLAIRQLAFRHLAIMAPDAAMKIRYDPGDSTDLRDRAVEEWKKWLETRSGPGPDKKKDK